MKSFLIPLTAVVAILTAYTTINWKKSTLTQKIGFILTILAGIIGALVAWEDQKKQDLLERVSAKVGEIKDKTGAKIISFKIGKGTATFYVKESEFLVTDNAPLIKVEIVNGKMFCTTIVYRKGKPIAVLDNNVWTMYSDDYEYNNDEYGFELVEKGTRDVDFQIYYLHGMLHLLGMFVDKHGVGVNFANYNDTASTIQPIYNDRIAADSSAIIKTANGRIFKYPRQKYLSQRIEH